MAILPTIRGLEVFIATSDRRSYEEYDDDEAKATDERGVPTSSKYIESVTDQAFEIAFRNTTAYEQTSEGLTWFLFIDGGLVGATASKFPEYVGKQQFLKGRYISLHTFQAFKFAKVETISDDKDSDNIVEEAEEFAKIGEIKVEIWRSKGFTFVNREGASNILPAPKPQTVVHEKALKGQAKSHRFSLGETQQNAPKSIAKSISTKIDSLPIAQFIFKYRSKEALKSLLIIQRTPEPEVTAPLEPVITPVDNLETGQQRVEELPAQSLKMKTKRERDENHILPASSSSKKLKNSGGEANIDLLDK